MKIVDNALPQKTFDELSNLVLVGGDFNWFLYHGVACDGGKDGYYFVHTFYSDFQPNSRFFPLLKPLLNILNPKALMRIKANLYPSSPSLIAHDFHLDTKFENLNAIFYLNTNDGFTEFKQGDRVDSVANRLLIFDNKEWHRSTNCTDMLNPRVTINFNYF